MHIEGNIDDHGSTQSQAHSLMIYVTSKGGGAIGHPILFILQGPRKKIFQNKTATRK
jgi:hypothetical protein